MTATYEKIATSTLGSAAADVTFSSISGSYTDLVLVIVPKSASGSVDLYIQVGNGSVNTGTNYSRTIVRGTGSAAESIRSSNIAFIRPTSNVGVDTTFNSNFILNFMNYSNTTTNKTVLSRTNDATDGTEAGVYLWRSTSAINIMKIYLSGGINLASGSTFTLYGIKSE
jgi:hypothetical protein